MPPYQRASFIDSLGRRLVQCRQDCLGASNARNGTPPRCLYLEEADSNIGGVVVVGLNPGRAKKHEIDFYNTSRTSEELYNATKEFLRQNINTIPYYVKTRRFIERMGFTGSVLWTEIAKCELLCGFEQVSLEMQRNCTATYLTLELESCKGWPVVATGRTAFRTAALLAADRAVVGVPHPTGSRGSLFNVATGLNSDQRTEELRKQVSSATAANSAVWFGAGEA